jgi:hypothetical protein
MDVTYDLVNNKNLFSQGFEARISRNVLFNARLNLNRQYFMMIGYDHGTNINGSDYMETRNYTIYANQFHSSLAWQPTNFYRLTASLSHSNKNNGENTTPHESSGINEAALNFRISKANDKAIEWALKFTNIRFSGRQNSPEGYELLNGLQPGNNISWSLNWQQKLINGLQMNIMYEGRKSGDLAIIHMGRMQVTALF